MVKSQFCEDNCRIIAAVFIFICVLLLFMRIVNGIKLNLSSLWTRHTELASVCVCVCAEGNTQQYSSTVYSNKHIDSLLLAFSLSLSHSSSSSFFLQNLMILSFLFVPFQAFFSFLHNDVVFVAISLHLICNCAEKKPCNYKQDKIYRSTDNRRILFLSEELISEQTTSTCWIFVDGRQINKA